MEYGVPQGSILALLLFNMNSIDRLYECDDYDIETMFTIQLQTLVLLTLTQLFLNYK